MHSERLVERTRRITNDYWSGGKLRRWSAKSSLLSLACLLPLGDLSCAALEADFLARRPDPGAAEESPTAENAGDDSTASAKTLTVSSDEDTSGWSRAALFARWNQLRGDAYPLDGIERFVEPDRLDLSCDRDSLVSYAGTALRYQGALTVHPAFRERLSRFEAVVVAVANGVYGREPRRIRHVGAFSCRSSRNRSERLSEHALGNAIDIVGFDFAGLPRGQQLGELPRQLKGPFQVRVARHWDPKSGRVNELHAQFLRELTSRLAERRDIFRGLIGPSHRGHADHFHFDMSPWRYEWL
jgi:hypothetical protein